MGILRKNKDDDKRKFQMREKLIAIGDDFWIENEESEPSRSMGRRRARS